MRVMASSTVVPVPPVPVEGGKPSRGISIRSRLSKLCQEGQPHLARHLLDTLPRASTAVWNTVIIGFICNHMPLEALQLYAEMKSTPCTPSDCYTFSSTLKACSLTQNLMTGKALHSHLLRSQSNSRIVYNSLLNMYSSCLPPQSQHDYVLKVFAVMRKRNVVAWNTLISWFVKTHRHLHALRAFATLIKTSITPSPVTFVNVFPAVPDPKTALMFYALLLKFGADYVNDVFAVSSAIVLFSDLGCLDHARMVFDRCSNKNTEVWNTMIGGYVQNNCPLQGVDVFVRALESEEAVCDEVTFLSVISAVSQLQQIKLAHQLHAFVLKNLAATPVIVVNAIMVMYSRCNFVDTSFKVFDNMSQRDAVSWNTIISSFVQNGLDEEALMLVCEMQKQKFPIDSVTMTALLSAASNMRSSYIGRQTHAYLIRHGIQFEGMESYLIDMYAKSRLIRTSELLFQQNCPSDRDLATWNAMIAGYTQNELSDKAILILREALVHKVIPNAVTLASILPACSSMGSTTFARQLHGFAIRHFLDENVFVGTALVDTYSKSGAISYAENVFIRTPERNSVTYTTMIMSYGQHGMGKEALALYDSMLRCGIKPDAVTFVAILSACSYSGLVEEGLHIFEYMDELHKIKPSIEHYCCVADMLGRVGRVVEAYEFVQRLREDEINGYFELGKFIAEKLLNMETEKRIAGYHVLISNIYAEEGEWEKVDRVRNQMKEKGLQKEMGCSWVEIAGHVNFFVSRDEKHPQSGEIYYILDKLTMGMKDAGYKPRNNSNLNRILESSD
uniref:Pentatricopeptide repeat-containing protein n=1 Tax=Glycine max TaxID=3847 RepID=I1M652_SOYBN